MCYFLLWLYLNVQIASYFTDKLLRVVQDVQKHVNLRTLREGDEGPEHFRKLAGSQSIMTDPVLEFIKQVCHVLALDRLVQYDILVCSFCTFVCWVLQLIWVYYMLCLFLKRSDLYSWVKLFRWWEGIFSSWCMSKNSLQRQSSKTRVTPSLYQMSFAGFFLNLFQWLPCFVHHCFKFQYRLFPLCFQSNYNKSWYYSENS